MTTCANCGFQGNGKYCSECGHAYIIKRISISNLLHEVLHTFTHFDKGFIYTLKELAIRPGTMQKKYLLGERSRYQKPFSLFFICATITGLSFYFMETLSPQGAELDPTREDFLRHYFVILQAVLLPFFALMTWILLGNKNLNYAELLVQFTYTLAFGFLLLIPVGLLRQFHILPNQNWAKYVDIPVLAVYVIWTNLNFFNKQSSWVVIVKSVTILLVCWFASNILAEQVVKFMM
jgi:Protein of unknown function (DUF3667)